MARFISTHIFMVILYGVVTSTPPPLTVRVSASSSRELLLSWDPPVGVTGIKHYELSCRDVIEDKTTTVLLGANLTSYRLTNLKANGSYTIQIKWCKGEHSSQPASLTVRPIDVYRASIEERERPPAMLIFYGIIAGAVLLYLVVVGILLTYYCRKKRRDRSSFAVTLNRAGKLSALQNPPAGHDTIARYSRTEDLHQNRISTFANTRNVLSAPPTTTPLTRFSENDGYTRPVSSDYLHPVPDSAPQKAPPPLPERTTLPPRTTTTPEEIHYDDATILNQPIVKVTTGSATLPVRKTPSQRGAIMPDEPHLYEEPTQSLAKKKVVYKSTTLPQRSPYAAPEEQHYEEPTEINTSTKKPKPPKGKKSRSKNAPHQSTQSLANTGPPIDSRCPVRRNESMRATSNHSERPSIPIARADKSPARPIKSSATVQRNESTKSVTIQTEVESEESASCPSSLGRELLAAAGEGFQITLTLRSRGQVRQEVRPEVSYDLVQ